MWQRLFVAVVAALALSACYNHYRVVVGQHVELSGTDFRISENAGRNVLLVSTDQTDPEREVRDKAMHEAAARKYLDDTGRVNCKIVSGRAIVKEFQFMISCPPAS